MYLEVIAVLLQGELTGVLTHPVRDLDRYQDRESQSKDL